MCQGGLHRLLPAPPLPQAVGPSSLNHSLCAPQQAAPTGTLVVAPTLLLQWARHRPHPMHLRREALARLPSISFPSTMHPGRTEGAYPGPVGGESVMAHVQPLWGAAPVHAAVAQPSDATAAAWPSWSQSAPGAQAQAALPLPDPTLMYAMAQMMGQMQLAPGGLPPPFPAVPPAAPMPLPFPGGLPFHPGLPRGVDHTTAVAALRAALTAFARRTSSAPTHKHQVSLPSHGRPSCGSCVTPAPPLPDKHEARAH